MKNLQQFKFGGLYHTFLHIILYTIFMLYYLLLMGSKNIIQEGLWYYISLLIFSSYFAFVLISGAIFDFLVYILNKKESYKLAKALRIIFSVLAILILLLFSIWIYLLGKAFASTGQFWGKILQNGIWHKN